MFEVDLSSVYLSAGKPGDIAAYLHLSNSTYLRKIILDLASAHEIITRKMVIEKLGLKPTQAYHLLTALAGEGKLKTKKSGREIEYSTR